MKKKLSFEQECKNFVVEHLESAIESLEGIGGAADDADLPEVSGRIFTLIEELQDVLKVAQQRH